MIVCRWLVRLAAVAAIASAVHALVLTEESARQRVATAGHLKVDRAGD